jgi:PKD repeat protein
MAYSSRDRAVVMFGGQARNDTWALDVQSKTWIPLQADGAAGAPPPRAQITNSMVYDATNDVFVLFGGECNEDPACGAIPYGGLLGDTWIYRLSTNQWTLMTPTVSPPASHQHTLSYDAANGVVVLFGGETSDGLSHNDVWIYDVPSNAWSQVSIAGQLPAPRALHSMVYDPVLGEHVIYGGRASYVSVSEAVWSLQLTRLTGNAPPLASFVVNPGSGNISTTFQFDGSASRDPDGSIVSYAWNFGDGTTGTGATTSHQYAAAGNYTVRLTVTDNVGATGSNESTINVGSGAIPTTTSLASSQNPAAEGSNITFTATVSGNNPTGTVAFTDNGTPIAGCASVALASSSAQCATSSLVTGSHSIVATYSGDAANASSFSPALTQTVFTASGSINVALAANGGVASASSTYSSSYPAAGANNGDRKGTNWASGGGWNDATASTFPDWLQITFPSAQTIGEIDVFTVQDNYSNPINPSLATTFSAYGITAFEVQYWTGSAWAAVPGGIVTGNNKVWRQFTFPAISTDRIRVLVTGALYNYSRITEIEAWTADGGNGPVPTTTALGSSQNPAAEGSNITFTATVSGSNPTGTVAFTDNGTPIAGCASVALASSSAQCATSSLVTGSHSIVATYSGDAANASSFSPALTQTVFTASGSINVALAANGGVASASSTYSSSYPAAGANNGDRKGTNWASGGGWNDATASTFPDWLQITFPSAQTIGEIDVFTVQDNYSNPINPSLATTFSAYGITAFEVQYWTGSAWAAVPGGIVTGNNKVWRQFTFPAISTDRIRVLVTGALYNYSRITEIEAWTP